MNASTDSMESPAAAVESIPCLPALEAVPARAGFSRCETTAPPRQLFLFAPAEDYAARSRVCRPVRVRSGFRSGFGHDRRLDLLEGLDHHILLLAVGGLL